MCVCWMFNVIIVTSIACQQNVAKPRSRAFSCAVGFLKMLPAPSISVLDLFIHASAGHVPIVCDIWTASFWPLNSEPVERRKVFISTVELVAVMQQGCDECTAPFMHVTQWLEPHVVASLTCWHMPTDMFRLHAINVPHFHTHYILLELSLLVGHASLLPWSRAS